MADPKISNGIHREDETEAPTTVGLTPGGAASDTSAYAGAASSSAHSTRIAGRPGREEGDAESRAARSRAARELWAMADGHPLRAYSFGTVVTAGLLGFVIGRLFAR